MARRPTLHYKILASILYHHYRWATRHPCGSQTLPIAPWLRSLRTQRADLRRNLERLWDLGLLEHYEYHGTYVVVRPKLPVGAAWVAKTDTKPELCASEETHDVEI